MRRAKVYDMVGLPTEGDADIDELARFTVELSKILPVALGVAPFAAKRNTPMDGTRNAATQDIAFQARPGTPELNCCSVNGPRTLGMLSEWAALSSGDGIRVNYYGPCKISTPIVQLSQETDYPLTPSVRIKVSTPAAKHFTIDLRIPSWSAKTKVTVNGQVQQGVKSGAYYSIDREWKTGDTIELEFDLRPYFWIGEKECEGKVSIYRGPVLLAFDPAFNKIDVDELPAMDIKSLKLTPAHPDARTKPWMAFEAEAGGSGILLTDFASSGWGGAPYRTWLPCASAKPQDCTRTNPLRVCRPE
jgi:hypothetical protein